MTTPEITEKIKLILTEQIGADPDRIDLQKTWADHGADSLDEVEIVMAIEEEFGIDIDNEDAERLETLSVAAGIDWLESALSE